MLDPVTTAENEGQALVASVLRHLAEMRFRSTWGDLHEYLTECTWLLSEQVRGLAGRILAEVERRGSSEDKRAIPAMRYAIRLLDRAVVVVLPSKPDSRTATLLELVGDRNRAELATFLLDHAELHRGRGLTESLTAIDEILPNNNEAVSGRLADIRRLLVRCAEVGAEAAVAEVDFDVAFPHLSFPPACVESVDSAWTIDGNRLDALLRLHPGVTASTLFSTASPDDRADTHFKIGNAYHARYRRDARREDIDDAIRCFDRAVDTFTTRELAVRALINLSAVLDDRFSDWGDPADLEHKIAVCQSLTDSLDRRSLDWVRAAGGLGTGLKDRSRRTADPGELAQARDILTAVVDAAEQHPGELACARHNLGRVMAESYAFTGMLAFLRAAVDLHRRSVAVTRRTDGSWPVRVLSLGDVLRQLCDTTDDEEAVEESITALRDLVDSERGRATTRYGARNNLAISLAQRYSLRGERDDLDAAIGHLEHLLAEEPVTSPIRPGHVVSLATCLLLRHKATAEPDDLDRALDLYDSVATGPVQSTWFGLARAVNWANALATRHSRTGSEADRVQAVELYRDVCETARSTGATEAGWRVATRWAQWAEQRQDWSEAVEAYGYARPLMEQWYRDQHTAEERREVAYQIRSYAWHMAYTCGKAGDSAAAVASLEETRCLWLNDVMDWDTTDLEVLAGLDPVLHREWLAAHERSAELQALLTRSPESGPVAASALQAVRAELASLLERVRRLPGLSGFLHRPGMREIYAKAARSPIVYLITTARGGFAFITEGHEVRSLELPDLVEGSFSERLKAYLTAETGRATDARRYADELDAMTRWLWDAAVSQLAGALPGVDALVLVPVGTTSYVPWHAAWATGEDGERRYWSDTCLVTYAPSARVAAAEPVEAAPDAVLAVGDPEGAQLPWTMPELRAASAAPGSLLLTGAEATPAEVFRLMPNHTVLHLACHGALNLAVPTESALLLGNGHRLTVKDLVRKRLDHLRLAVLSACDSAFPSMHLTEEALGFPAILLSCGVAGVIGTLWPVSDLGTALLVERFYEYWRSGLPPAEALRSAQRWMRTTRRYAHPYHWAGFVYFGR